MLALCSCVLLGTGELGMVDEAQKLMEEAEALKKVISLPLLLLSTSLTIRNWDC